jgi:hypothetical protein
MATIFVSPGVYTREQDFSVFASRVGLTKLGLVGLTQKGPAFEPVRVRSTDEFLFRFGSTSNDLALPYVANAFLTQSSELTVTRVLGKEGYDDSPAWIIVGEGPSGSTVDGAVLAVIRSKYSLDALNPGFYVTDQSGITISVSTSGYTTPFTLSAFTSSLAGNSVLNVTLDETQDNYIVNILGKNPKEMPADYGIYVDTIYPHFIREAFQRGELTGISTTLVWNDSAAYTDFKTEFKSPVTPWIVSNVIGNQVRRLFKFKSISDGNSANREIKISIANIDLINKTFDVVVRDFNDTDASAFQTALERFRNVTLDSTSRNYIARVIGTTDEEYPRNSLFVTIDMAEGHPEDVIPAGFEGYTQREVGGTTATPFYYKTEYFTEDSVNKTFLGISELGFTGFTSGQVNFTNVINTVEVDMFKYIGANQTIGIEKIKGFHMENTAPSLEYVTGVFSSVSDYEKAQRKFTLAPAGGFDGWNKFKTPEFREVPFDAPNRQAFREALDVYANPEEVDINLFATPGINFKDNESLVKYALGLLEERADTLYIIDSPRVTDETAKGTPEEIVLNLQDTGIDSNYAATYWPWIQIEDQTSGKFVYIAPTAEVVKSIALTDNVSYPWFAPAGINRGSASDNVRRADIKLSQAQRDTLYEGRVNPIASFVQQGVVIYGQKTLQVRQSALDRINVRRLLLQIRRLVSAVSQTLLFEQNDQTLRDQFLSKVEPLLLQIQNQRGLAGFRVVMDETNNPPEVVDRNTLVGKIQLKPTRTAEFITLDFQVLPTGANFSDF